MHNEVIGWHISVGVIEGRNSTCRTSGKDKKKERLVILTPASYYLLPKNDLKSQSILLKELSTSILILVTDMKNKGFLCKYI